MFSSSHLFLRNGSNLSRGQFPLGFNKKQFVRMRNNPFGRKPWRGTPAHLRDATVSTALITDAMSSRRRLSGGDEHDPWMEEGTSWKNKSAEEPSSSRPRLEQQDDAEEYSEDYYNPSADKNVATSSEPTSSASATEEQRQWLRDVNSGRRAVVPQLSSTSSTSKSFTSPVPGFGFQRRPPSGRDVVVAHEDDDGDGDELVVGASSPSSSLVNVGGDLALNVKPNNDATTLADGMTLSSISHSFDTKTRKSQLVLPRHLNDLFSKISKWSSDLKTAPASATRDDDDGDDVLGGGGEQQQIDLDNRTGTIDNPSPEAVRANPQLAKHAMARAQEKLQYGALMDSFENDRHAIENKLMVAGSKFERRFMNWQGAKLLENVPQQQMHDTVQSKGSLVLHSPQAFKIPKVNHDHCTGCGAVIQNENDGEFGYCYPGDIEQYILNWQSVFKARADYAERMHELTSHWERHGKRVGEEWLDFMTQEEFNAIFRFVGRPFICRRCLSLRNYGVTTASTLMTAPDFKEKLAALRDKKCVVVLVVDLSDFPGSMVPELPGLISMNNPVIIAANKLDTVNPASFEYKGNNLSKRGLRVGAGYIRQWVKEQALQFRLPSHQIKAVVPVSSRMGWGIRELIGQIERHSNLTLRKPTPPVPTYFVGVSNVGKSSLINAIAHHLYVPQPPHPTSKKQYFTFIDSRTGVERIAHRWITDKRLHAAEMSVVQSTKSKKQTQLMTVSALPGTTINAVAVKVSIGGGGGDEKENQNNSNKYPHTYLFDTPGLNPVWQEMSPLSIRDQVRCLVPKRFNPVATLLEEGSTLFLSGAACIDVVKSSEQLMFFTYHSRHVTTSFCPTENSDAYWREHAGKTLKPPSAPEMLLMVNDGDQQHQQEQGQQGDASSSSSSSLCVKRSYLFECYDHHLKRPKADIYFCGIGWVSFFVKAQCDVVLRVRTLPGIVHGVRKPLRRLDMRPYRPWPRLPQRYKAMQTARLKEKEIDKVVEFENRPVGEEDLAKPPLVEVPKMEPVSSIRRGLDDDDNDDEDDEHDLKKKKQHQRTSSAAKPKQQASNSAPFDFLMQELKKQGKIPASA